MPDREDKTGLNAPCEGGGQRRQKSEKWHYNRQGKHIVAGKRGRVKFVGRPEGVRLTSREICLRTSLGR